MLTTRQKILCLSAAAIASEGPGLPDDIRAAVDLLDEALAEYFDESFRLAIERDGAYDNKAVARETIHAVMALSLSPESFGCD